MTETMVAAVLEAARRQLGEVGPTALSLRAIAREVGVVPSALYRYLPGREAILTELIRTGYERLAEAVRSAEAEHDRADHLGRWLTTWQTTRAWALEHPHEYALLYGTPVVGYQAPAETVRPAIQVALMLARIALEARAAGARVDDEALVDALAADADAIAGQLPELGIAVDSPIPQGLTMLVIDAWTTLYGAISFELFGHYENAITARVEHLEALARRQAAALGLA